MKRKEKESLKKLNRRTGFLPYLPIPFLPHSPIVCKIFVASFTETFRNAGWEWKHWNLLSLQHNKNSKKFHHI